MPFKSKAQMKKILMLEQEGKVPKGTFEKWKKHTRNIKSLPEKAKKDKSRKKANFFELFKKVAATLNSVANAIGTIPFDNNIETAVSVVPTPLASATRRNRKGIITPLGSSVVENARQKYNNIYSGKLPDGFKHAFESVFPTSTIRQPKPKIVLPGLAQRTVDSVSLGPIKNVSE